MEESTKRPILLGVIVVCLVLAGVITFMTRSEKTGIPESFAKQMTWVKCRNPDCEAEYQVNKKDYFDYIVKHKVPGSRTIPPLICKKCGEPGVYRAVKCEKCGLVFEIGTIPRDFEDRCPKCGYSKTEQDRTAGAPAEGG